MNNKSSCPGHAWAAETWRFPLPQREDAAWAASPALVAELTPGPAGTTAVPTKALAPLHGRLALRPHGSLVLPGQDVSTLAAFCPGESKRKKDK